MNTAELNHFKVLFEALKEQVLAKPTVSNQGDSQLLGHGDIIDQSTNERETKMSYKLQGRDVFFLKKIEIALEKIEDGTFGHCEECNCEIGMKRLLARPIASQCINCKEEGERAEGHILYEKRSRTNGSSLINNTNAVFSL